MVLDVAFARGAADKARRPGGGREHGAGDREKQTKVRLTSVCSDTDMIFNWTLIPDNEDTDRTC